MADSKPVKLSAERWGWLRDFIAAHYPDQQPADEITVNVATEVRGITFLPARYIGPEEADPMPAEPPIKPKPAPAYL